MNQKKKTIIIIGLIVLMVIAGAIVGVVTVGNKNADASRGQSATPGEAQAESDLEDELPVVPIQAEESGSVDAVPGDSAIGNSGKQDSPSTAGTNGKQDSPSTAGTNGKQDGQSTSGAGGKKTDEPSATTENATTEKTTTESTTTEHGTTEQPTTKPDDSGAVELPFVPAE